MTGGKNDIKSIETMSLISEEPLVYTRCQLQEEFLKCFQCYCVVDSTITEEEEKSYLSFHNVLWGLLGVSL